MIDTQCFQPMTTRSYHHHHQMTVSASHYHKDSQKCKRGKISCLFDLVFCSLMASHYGNRGCGVFKGGVQNQKGFCIRINMPKGNYWILKIGLVGSLSSLQKPECLKLIILIFHEKKWITKGQLISKCFIDSIVSTKKPTKFFYEKSK